MKAKGAILDRGRHRYTTFEIAKRRIGAGYIQLPSAMDLSHFAPPVMDQGPCGSCEGHSTAGAIFTSLAAQRAQLPWVPSPLDIYRLARCVDRVDPNVPLTDEGTETNAVIRAISEWGIRPMGALMADRFSDCGPDNVNLEPPLGDLEQDSLTLVVGAYQITSTGNAKLSDVKTALVNGYAVRVDSFVDSAFEQWTPEQPPYGVPDETDPNGGGHALYAIGYEADHIVIRNSWGSGWGDAGNIRVSAAFIEQADCYAWKVQRSA